MIDFKELDFFSKFNDEDMKKLSSISVQKSFNKDEILFFEGDEPKYLYILLDGILKTYKTNLKSQEIFLHHLMPVSFVAELANFENIPYPASASFLTSGEVLAIEYEKFQKDFLSHPLMSFTIIRSLSSKLRIVNEVLNKELILTSEAKIAKFIVENGELFGVIKNVNIASILNITPETLSRILAKFKHDKLIVLDKHNVLQQVDMKSLKNLYSYM
ncbi:MAG: Crp/Fnr family transcriptional regulator [Campylobacteraceae bacterium]|nr:Crp/Fnr family transcriptional regulator [Campylobacteraceae bacterium]